MNLNTDQRLINQVTYARALRSLLPPEAFAPDASKLIILVINLAILILGWMIAAHLDSWSIYLLWLYLPLTIIMGNSVIALLFSSHDLMHGSVIRNSKLAYFFSFLGLTMLWMPPTLWKSVHNRVHHHQTNGLGDPDRNYLEKQSKTWGKWIHHLFVPSPEVNPLWLIVGMTSAWGVHNFRNLTSVLFFNSKSVDYVPAAFTVNAKDRRAIAAEIVLMSIIHLSILAYLEFNPLKLILGYFLPVAIGNAGLMFYIYTNHLLCPMTDVNDPLVNSTSLRVYKFFDLLHFNFSHHTEHHIFPGMNSDYYVMVRELLKTDYAEKFNLLDAQEAWRLLMQSYRHYKDENSLTDWAGKNIMPCPLNQKLKV
ncbi:fatty acid desaturase family protein [Nodularia sp. NIES-3585]|uniref:fatty acid desaturase family protein n=1 Tax=Nodularia sp. NIES-3585 TaxID=1973477 RepID=UPI000B5C6500|nr:fatty acid desaturase [Nodularia sp. NIES-3585]GAX37807.1 fatty acid desaturase [Nodularia sp. NIES-3585]